MKSIALDSFSIVFNNRKSSTMVGGEKQIRYTHRFFISKKSKSKLPIFQNKKSGSLRNRICFFVILDSFSIAPAMKNGPKGGLTKKLHCYAMVAFLLKSTEVHFVVDFKRKAP